MKLRGSGWLIGFLVLGFVQALQLSAVQPQQRQRPFHDRLHYSNVFEQERNYRLFLPRNYWNSDASYPVIYYFHGHSDRFTLERYDQGTETVPAIADFVMNHDVIVVSVDGYVAEHYTGFYGGDPWDIREVDGGDYDFGEYLLELVEHIDSQYRTLSDRRNRALSGLSMGGFMSLYLSARYPDLIGSASAFNPGPEFFVGDKGRRVLWRPKDHVGNHAGRWVRLIRASGDYISQYHEETRDAYARAGQVRFEFRQDEYHKHAATSIAETFETHMRAFADPTLDNFPDEWSYTSPSKVFDVWGYHVNAPGKEKGFVYLEQVRQGGLRVRTRLWAPDGPPLKSRRIRIRTAGLYKPAQSYTLIDHSLDDGTTIRREVTSDAQGRIAFELDGLGHQISFVGPGTGAQPPVVLPYTKRERLYVHPGEVLELPVRIYNPRGREMTNVSVTLTSEYPTVEIVGDKHEVESIGAGEFVDLSGSLLVRFVSGSGFYAPARLRLHLIYDGWYERWADIDVAIAPEVIPEPAELLVMDGRSTVLNVFRQKGNQGGGSSVKREVSEGKGNGNGILEPGESGTFWVKMDQGMDPFDKGNWYRCKVRSDSPWVEEVSDIQEEKQREWTGAKNRSNLVRLSTEAPAGTVIQLDLENESWSFHYTPDVRYGTEPLYQAFQLHTFHLHRYELTVPVSK